LIKRSCCFAAVHGPVVALFGRASRAAIAEGHYIIEDGTVTLTDVMGKPFPGEQYKRKLAPADDEMVIARQPLRSKASD
jgi:hypothetical protein